MKTRKKFSAIVVALALAMGLVVGAGAATAQQKIAATLDQGITIKLDGEVVIPKDTNGARVYPIMYNGSTYLPLRAVGGMVGLDVDWDGPSRTVLLMSKPADGVDLIDTFKYYYRSSDQSTQVQSVSKKNQDISGVSLSHWIKVYGSSTWDKGTTSKVSFNLENKYDTISFKYYCSADTILRVLGDNDGVLFEKEVKGGQVAQVVTDLPLFKTGELAFQTERTFSWSRGQESSVYIFDAKLK